MKKSQALGLITEIVSEVTYEALAKKRAEKILAALEEAGMLPPETVRYTEQENGNTLCNPENSWDPEDE